MINNMRAIVLAAGKGSRLNCENKSKILKKLAGREMILYTIDLLRLLGFKTKEIYIVLGFDSVSIKKCLGASFNYVFQKKLLGTGDAVKQAYAEIPPHVKNVLILQGDDSAFYPPDEIRRLIKDHLSKQNDLTFLTVEKAKPTVGRILRDRFGRLTKIVEHKNATAKQLQVKEINAAVYLVKSSFAREYLPKIKANSLTKEFYLPDLINLGLKNKKIIMPIKMSNNDYFQGVNTKEELLSADKKMKQKLSL